MTQPPPPPYAGPPGVVPIPRRPVRARPSGWWFAVGAGLLVVAIGVGIALLWHALGGFLDTEATVAADGRPHQVSVGTDGDRLLWLEDGFPQQCVLRDQVGRREIVPAPATGTYTRSDSSGAWSGAARFAPGSGDLEVTCTGEGTVLVGPVPQVGNFVLTILAAIGVPLVLGGSGLVVLVVTGVLFATRPPRRTVPRAQEG